MEDLSAKASQERKDMEERHTLVQKKVKLVLLAGLMMSFCLSVCLVCQCQSYPRGERHGGMSNSRPKQDVF